MNDALKMELYSVIIDKVDLGGKKLYSYLSLDGSRVDDILASFGDTIDPDDIVAMLDVSLWKDADTGFLFLKDGLYYKSWTCRTGYIPYDGILKVRSEVDVFGPRSLTSALTIFMSDGEVKRITADASFDKNNLRAVIADLVDTWRSHEMHGSRDPFEGSSPQVYGAGAGFDDPEDLVEDPPDECVASLAGDSAGQHTVHLKQGAGPDRRGRTMRLDDADPEGMFL